MKRIVTTVADGASVTAAALENFLADGAAVTIARLENTVVNTNGGTIAQRVIFKMRGGIVRVSPKRLIRRVQL